MRKLTISTLRRQWGAMYRSREAYVPSIRLNGNWLADAGFEAGKKIRVYVGNGALRVETEVSPQSRP